MAFIVPIRRAVFDDPSDYDSVTYEISLWCFTDRYEIHMSTNEGMETVDVETIGDVTQDEAVRVWAEHVATLVYSIV